MPRTRFGRPKPRLTCHRITDILCDIIKKCYSNKGKKMEHQNSSWPEKFIERVKKEYPDNKNLHETLANTSADPSWVLRHLSELASCNEPDYKDLLKLLKERKLEELEGILTTIVRQKDLVLECEVVMKLHQELADHVESDSLYDNPS